jgi:hypothetical protein
VSGGAYSTLVMSRRSARELDDLLGQGLGRLGVWRQQALFTEDTQFLVYMNGVGSEPTEDLYGNDELQARRLRAVGGGRPSHGRDRRAPARPPATEAGGRGAAVACAKAPMDVVGDVPVLGDNAPAAPGGARVLIDVRV